MANQYKMQPYSQVSAALFFYIILLQNSFQFMTHFFLAAIEMSPCLFSFESTLVMEKHLAEAELIKVTSNESLLKTVFLYQHTKC